MNRSVIYFLLIILCCAGVFLNFNKSLEDMPRTCDEFGYLNQAKAFEENTVFDTSRPYLDGLLDSLRQSSISEFELFWFPVPFAYYVVPNTNKTINMYPPGTAYLLRWIPLEYRRQAFPVIALCLFFIIPLFFFKKREGNGLGWFDLSMFILVLLMVLVFPLRTELMRVNSLAFTFGLLLAAGMVLEKKPLISCALIVLASNFRVVNVLMLLPLIAFVKLPKSLGPEDLKYLTTLFFKYLLVSVICISPYLIYMYLLLGNPFLPTHLYVDTEMNESPVANILFYFNISQRWFVIHLLLIGILAWLSKLKKITWTFSLKLMLFPIVGYLYFVFKTITMNYYPYASAFILLGVCFNEFGKFPVSTKQMKIITITCITIGVAIFVGGVFEYKNVEHQNFTQAKQKYQGLCKYDIVWADVMSGTTEYACENIGFRYNWTSPAARKIALQYLHNKNYSQAILLNDIPYESSFILNEVKAFGLKYHVVEDPFMGTIIAID